MSLGNIACCPCTRGHTVRSFRRSWRHQCRIWFPKGKCRSPAGRCSHLPPRRELSTGLPCPLFAPFRRCSEWRGRIGAVGRFGGGSAHSSTGSHGKALAKSQHAEYGVPPQSLVPSLGRCGEGHEKSSTRLKLHGRCLAGPGSRGAVCSVGSALLEALKVRCRATSNLGARNSIPERLQPLVGK